MLNYIQAKMICHVRTQHQADSTIPSLVSESLLGIATTLD